MGAWEREYGARAMRMWAGWRGYHGGHFPRGEGHLHARELAVAADGIPGVAVWLFCQHLWGAVGAGRPGEFLRQPELKGSGRIGGRDGDWKRTIVLCCCGCVTEASSGTNEVRLNCGASGTGLRADLHGKTENGPSR